MQFIDSHCHLHSLDLSQFSNGLDEVISAAVAQHIKKMLCVCIEPADIAIIQALADHYPQLYSSVGIHPNVEVAHEPELHQLMEWAAHSSCIAIGETGLDYYRTESDMARGIQQARFSRHIQAAKTLKKPLIIHTREAATDTIALMKSNQADEIGGVMHCFVEDWAVAQQALDLNFYISFSGILSFKNATQIQEVAKKVPMDRILIETDSPYLAPVPYRGKQNQPAYVVEVARALATLRGISLEDVALHTTANFYRCFQIQDSA